MTDSEKLDLLLSEMQNMKAEMQKTRSETQELRTENQAEIREMRAEIQGLRAETQSMRAENQDIQKDIHEIRQKVNRLEVGQAELKREIYRIDRKISDTYNLALDAWGQGVENRTYLEENLQKA